MAHLLKERITQEANALGFQAVRFASADPPPRAGAALDVFLANGRHGDMAWLAANPERRKSPRAIWPDVKSVIMLGMSYGPERNPLEALAQRSRGAISVYAQGADYHDVLKAKLKPLASRVQALTGSEVKLFVDTAPVMEKPLAARAGLGVSRAWRHVGQEAIQLHGGIAMTAEYSVGSYTSHLTALDHLLGDGQHHLALLSAGVGDHAEVDPLG